MRAEKALSSPKTLHAVRHHWAALRLAVSVWLDDVRRAALSLRQYRSAPSNLPAEDPLAEERVAAHEMRWLALKLRTKDGLSPGQQNRLDALLKRYPRLSAGRRYVDALLFHAVAVYRATGRADLMREILDESLEETIRRGLGVPVALPDFLQAAREAGLWTPEVRRWLARIKRKGFILPARPEQAQVEVPGDSSRRPSDRPPR